MTEFQRGHWYKGMFITLDGGEGSGKSTVMRGVLTELRGKGYFVVVGREPGGTIIGEEIRHVLQYSKSNGGMSPETELFLFEGARAQLFREVVVPTLIGGGIYFSDRGDDSSSAYQGRGRGLDVEFIDLANRIASQGIKPDLTFILDIDPKIGLELARGKGVRDRMESQAMDFYERVREGYLEVARREPKRCKVIESVKDKLDVAKLQIMEEISKFIRIYDLDRILKK